MTVILKFQSTGSIPGKGNPVTIKGTGLTIGRGSENELVLPDPNRELSKRHCAIEDNNGNVAIVDFSTNGTFLNGLMRRLYLEFIFTIYNRSLIIVLTISTATVLYLLFGIIISAYSFIGSINCWCIGFNVV